MSERKAHKICATCGHLLERATREGVTGWVHIAELLGQGDHLAVPIDYDERYLTSSCDFCNADVPLAERHFLPVNDFTVALPIGGPLKSFTSRGGYNSCPVCADLVRQEDWDGMLTRYGGLHPEHAAVLAALEIIWGAVRKNTTGPVRRWRPGDELSTPD